MDDQIGRITEVKCRMTKPMLPSLRIIIYQLMNVPPFFDLMSFIEHSLMIYCKTDDFLDIASWCFESYSIFSDVVREDNVFLVHKCRRSYVQVLP